MVHLKNWDNAEDGEVDEPPEPSSNDHTNNNEQERGDVNRAQANANGADTNEEMDEEVGELDKVGSSRSTTRVLTSTIARLALPGTRGGTAYGGQTDAATARWSSMLESRNETKGVDEAGSSRSTTLGLTSIAAKHVSPVTRECTAYDQLPGIATASQSKKLERRSWARTSEPLRMEVGSFLMPITKLGAYAGSTLLFKKPLSSSLPGMLPREEAPINYGFAVFASKKNFGQSLGPIILQYIMSPVPFMEPVNFFFGEAVRIEW